MGSITVVRIASDATALATLVGLALMWSPAAAQDPPAGPRAERGDETPRAATGPRRHPALTTGWARPREPGVALRRTPDPEREPTVAAVPERVAGRVIRAGWGADGQVWLRLALPDRTGGWAPAPDLLPAPDPPTLSGTAVAAIRAARRGLGPRHSVVVRDPLGRTLLEEGTHRPLVLASVTKLATMAAALERFGVDRSTASSVLGRSDNGRAQALSDRVGGGSARAGARATERAIAAMGADWRLADGSGLLAGNRASGAEVADLLAAVRERPWFGLYLRSMPLAGRSGTLAARMTTGPARARVRAKTGTLFTPQVSSLAGYAWPATSGLAPRRALVVVILSNGRDYRAVRPYQDAIMRAVTARGAVYADRPAATR